MYKGLNAIYPMGENRMKPNFSILLNPEFYLEHSRKTVV